MPLPPPRVRSVPQNPIVGAPERQGGGIANQALSDGASRRQGASDTHKFATQNVGVRVPVWQCRWVKRPRLQQRGLAGVVDEQAVVAQAQAGVAPEAVLEAMKSSGWQEEVAIKALEETLRNHLVQQGAAWWAHIGDSRLYHLRHGALVLRSRDHSHVELLLREGLITADQAQTHPMRNFVECCLGGDPIVPDMTLTRRRALEPNDVLLVCTDGFWAGVKDSEIAGEVSAPGVALKEKLLELAQRAVMRTGAASDNTSVAALRWIG